MWESTFSKWYELLKGYKEEYGDCLVPQIYETKEGFRLGIFVKDLRKGEHKLTMEQREKIDNLGFVWKISDKCFNRGYEELRRYKEEYGDCLVQYKYETKDGYKLGIWLRNIRCGGYKLNEEQKKKLDELGFVWKIRKKVENNNLFEKGCEELKKYKARYGNCLIKQSYITESGYKLGSWVTNIRRFKDKLSKDRIKRLDELGFIWKVRK